MKQSRQPVPTEASILRQCRDYLTARRLFHWRNNSGSLRNAKGRPVRFGEVGSADLMVLLPEHEILGQYSRVYPAGRLLAVEIKRFGNEPTPYQQAWLDNAAAAGAAVGVVHSLEELQELLRSLGV